MTLLQVETRKLQVKMADDWWWPDFFYFFSYSVLLWQAFVRFQQIS